MYDFENDPSAVVIAALNKVSLVVIAINKRARDLHRVQYIHLGFGTRRSCNDGNIRRLYPQREVVSLMNSGRTEKVACPSMNCQQSAVLLRTSRNQCHSMHCNK